MCAPNSLEKIIERAPTVTEYVPIKNKARIVFPSVLVGPWNMRLCQSGVAADALAKLAGYI